MKDAESETVVSNNEDEMFPIPAIKVDDEQAPESFGATPDGGIRAWLVVAGAFFILCSTLGYANSFGVFQEYYLAHQLHDRPPDDIAWIGSLATFLQLSAGAISGPLFDRYGSWILRPAAILYIFSVMMVSICREYWHFMLTQGVVIGMLMALFLVPAIAAVSQYFDKRRATALGITVSGSSVGGVIFPIALSKMLNDSSLGFGWSIRIMGFAVLPGLVFSCITVRTRLPPRTTGFFVKAAFKDVKYVLLIIGASFVFIGFSTPIWFLPTYAVSRGMDTTLASYMLAIINGASALGRIIPGVLADKFGRINILGIGSIVTGVIVSCMNETESTAALVVFSVAFGFSSGTIMSGIAAAFSVCAKDHRDIGTYLGMGMAISSVAILIGPPVNGALVAKYHGFFEACIFSGIMCLVGGFIVFGSKMTTSQGIFGKV
ncbi:monocarboxylate permease-like protein [Histoplasma capsulatum var. duboisii H88]|uniref:Monocarboxylate permease-like protein n=1 Tax=Ajellomyces capsulatus (strain H88) TaxID=544711 RepID=F0UA27_AJEC8|nr:monocarboxylate permease-like protein [Histoplasma capsulatum var. duboisii H88]QSS48991.1 monocarboxylate permease-like protein [Histoplasma capsulatum var. duboisii H88]